LPAKKRMKTNNDKWQLATEVLKKGQVAVIPTDTIYGLVGQALNKKTVEKIYKIKGRKPNKPLIILISSFKDLEKFSIKITSKEKKILKEIWPGPISVILKAPSKKFEYLHRGIKTLSFRLPANEKLIKLIKKTGPLVAPSANPEKKEPARNTKEAWNYFGEQVPVYLPSDKKLSKYPSSLISLLAGQINTIRPGQKMAKIKEIKKDLKI